MIKNYLLFSLLFICNSIYAKEKTYIALYKEEYNVLSQTEGFQRTIFSRGLFKEDIYTANIYFGELESIESIIASTKNQKGKIKKVGKDKIYKSDIMSSTFFSGYKAQRIDFNKDAENNIQSFLYQVNVKNKELMCLTDLMFYQPNEAIIDTFEYIIRVPNSHRMMINTRDLKEDSLIHIDSTITEKETIYRFTKKFLPKNFSYDKDKIPKIENDFSSIRVIVIPINAEPYNYFNNWYQNLLNTIPISNKYKNICDSIIKISSNKDSIISNTFKYVTNKIKYIDIENGINAFVPRKSDDVLYVQQGDCKDMAYLLYNMYNYMGFEANIALSSTLSHQYQFDFPSLASANHAICILKLDGRNYYLDATEYNGEYSIPSRQIQNTKAFISKKNNFELINIPAESNDFNLSTSEYQLEFIANKIKGNFKTNYKGYSKLNIEDITKRYSKTKSQQLLTNYLKGDKKTVNYSEINFSNKENKLILEGHVELALNIINKVNTKYYLNLAFTPFPHSFDREIDTNVHHVLYNTSKNTYSINIIFPEKINGVESPYKNTKYIKDGIEYYFDIKYKGNILAIEYTYINPYVKLDKKITPTYNAINQIIQTTLNHEIIIY